VILLAGIPTETPLAMVASALDRLGAPYLLWNQRLVRETSVDIDLVGGRLGGSLTVSGRPLDLTHVTAAYPRLMDPERLPELARGTVDDTELARGLAVHRLLDGWLEVSPARVVNRSAPQGSNGSKPYQGQLIRDVGFRVPETLVSNDPAAIHDFIARHRRVVYKSMSGVRSIVRTVDDDALERIDRVRWCPVQFQAFVEGVNVRVHTVGATAAFASLVRSDGVDYRYAEGPAAEVAATALPVQVEERCLQLAARLGLHFAGIDLKIDPSGEAWCLEVNPSPAFSYYEGQTGQPIADAVAAYLAGRAPQHPMLSETGPVYGSSSAGLT
jgi:hypothetical protein